MFDSPCGESFFGYPSNQVDEKGLPIPKESMYNSCGKEYYNIVLNYFSKKGVVPEWVVEVPVNLIPIYARGCCRRWIV
ncbi:hypothetical protein CULT_270005 [[Clostridium] ultunense Esp]|nr:hypothetical protein CULT_270005 [[Clostridium] ultunense Esp]